MKLLKLFTVVGLLLVSINLSAEGKKLKANEARVLYSITIDCESCEAKINKIIPFVKGIKDVKIDLKKQTISVVYRKDKTDKQKISKELEKIGYPTKEIKKVKKK